jgi:uncharacterized membrane protein YdjX (TVP38/TMEM64 family)
MTTNGTSAVRYLPRIALLILLCVAALLAYTHRDALDAKSITQAVQSVGAFAPLAFMAIYAVATVALTCATSFSGAPALTANWRPR